MKKIWKRPKLIVLYRGRPEEMVLVACKLATRSFGGPSNPAGGRMNCQPWRVAPSTCYSQCSSYSAS
jgi:hypothetical protein